MQLTERGQRLLLAGIAATKVAAFAVVALGVMLFVGYVETLGN